MIALVCLALAWPGAAAAYLSPGAVFGACGDGYCFEENCTICPADCGACPAPECGDDIINDSGAASSGPMEECDGPDLGGEDCQSLGYEAGDLYCDDDCTFDTSDCANPDCGNNIVEPSEDCELDSQNRVRGQGNILMEDCSDVDPDFVEGDLGCTDDCTFDLIDCRYVTCGDGLVEGSEECDDQNPYDGDGCDENCLIESGWECTGAPSDCLPICGDGTIYWPEECDDGDDNSGDGCDDECYGEPGWVCVGEPSDCDTECGDGLRAPNEPCDDGNNDDNDGCDEDCDIEDNWICSGDLGETSVCVSNCGDGVVDPEEECDDGNNLDEDGCSGGCIEEYCGDGTWQSDLGEECDDGPFPLTDEPNTCRMGCVTPFCGDGTTDDEWGEECDDGNAEEFDGCDSDCKDELLYCCEEYSLDGEPAQPVSNDCLVSRITFFPENCAFNCDRDFCQSCGGGSLWDALTCSVDVCTQIGCIPGQPTLLGWLFNLLGNPYVLESTSCDISPECPNF